VAGTGDGTVTTHIAQLPGMASGELGFAGVDKPGPTVRTVAVPVVRYIAEEISYSWLRAFLGLLAVDGLGLAQLTPPSDAFMHLYRIGGIALAPAALSLAQELYAYLSKVRASRGQA
jgi:hypothetical protein